MITLQSLLKKHLSTVYPEPELLHTILGKTRRRNRFRQMAAALASIVIALGIGIPSYRQYRVYQDPTINEIRFEDESFAAEMRDYEEMIRAEERLLLELQQQDADIPEDLL